MTHLLRGPSLLTVGERELIAACASALNASDYCLGFTSGPPRRSASKSRR